MIESEETDEAAKAAARRNLAFSQQVRDERAGEDAGAGAPEPPSSTSGRQIPTGFLRAVYDMALEVLKFYKQVFNYDSLDGQGMAINSSVHFGQKLGNDFWLGGDRQMVYGDGNSFLHNFTKCVDVIGHEMTVSKLSTRGLWRRGLTIVDTARCDSVQRRARLPR